MSISSSQLAELIEQHAVPLKMWAGTRCGEAEDVVQEAFCRLAVVKKVPENPTGWLYRVVRNLSENERLSSSRRRSREEQVAHQEAYQQEPLEHLHQQELVSAVWELDQEFREVLTTRIWGQLSFEEIGELCQISTATASRRYQSALQQLRKIMEVPCPTSPR